MKGLIIITFILILCSIIFLFIYAAINYIYCNKLVLNKIITLQPPTNTKTPNEWLKQFDIIEETIHKFFDANILSFLITMITTVILSTSIAFLISANQKFEEMRKDIEVVQNKSKKDTELKIFILKEEIRWLELNYIIYKIDIAINAYNFLKYKTKKSIEKKYINIKSYLYDFRNIVRWCEKIPGYITEYFGSQRSKLKLDEDDDIVKLMNELSNIIDEKKIKDDKDYEFK